MRPIILSWLLTSFCLTILPAAQAQQTKSVARICYLGNTASTAAEGLKPFRARLRELGYIEGQNIVIESRYWQGKVDRLPGLAAELVRINCAVVLTIGSEAAQAAKNEITTIPVVMAFGADAVKSGIVASLARPGGNITGMTNIGAELHGKRLEILTETVPKLARVAFLWSPSNPAVKEEVQEMATVSRSFRLALQSLEAKVPGDIEAGFKAAAEKRAQALMLGSGGFFAAHQGRLIELATKAKLPTMYNNTRYVEAGGLMTYTYDRGENYRRAAEIVDKIFKGTKPADIPVERPKKFDFVINLKTAKATGLTIPPNVLVRATRVIR